MRCETSKFIGSCRCLRFVQFPIAALYSLSVSPPQQKNTLNHCIFIGESQIIPRAHQLVCVRLCCFGLRTRLRNPVKSVVLAKNAEIERCRYTNTVVKTVATSWKPYRRVSDERLIECPQCHSPSLVKKISAAGFRLKGGGWYETDFKNKNKKNVSASDSAGDGGGSASSDSSAGDAKGAGSKTDAASKGDTKSSTDSTTKSSGGGSESSSSGS